MKRLIIVLCIGLIVSKTSGQIIQVYEEVKNSYDTLNLGEPNIVDINSRLVVKIDKLKLIGAASNSKGINKELSEQLDNLNFLLVNQIEILEMLQDSMEGASHADKIKVLGKYSTLMDTFYKKLQSPENTEIRESYNVYSQEFFDLFRVGDIDLKLFPNPQTYALIKLVEDVEKVLKTMGESEDFQKLTFQLIAFLNTRKEYHRRVHIENFDDIAEGEIFEVERWVTSFSEEDKAEFQKTQALANTLNELLDKDIKDLNQLLHNQFKSIGCYTEINTKVQYILNHRDTIFKGVNLKIGEEFLNNIKTEFKGFKDIISSLKDELGKSDDNSSNYDLYIEKQNKFFTAADNITGKINNIVTDFNSQIENPHEKITELVNQVDTCLGYLSKDIETVKSIASFTNEVLNPFKQTAAVADSVGDKVLSFSLDELPEKGYINLKTTGSRRNGDELEINIRVKDEEDVKKHSAGETLEKRVFKLQQIKVYSVTKVTLILAVPFPEPWVKLQDQNDVQFAPSGSLLFKIGSRNSKAWNFINMGVGFNISTPDFNLDGTPDVGLGAIVTVLKDVVSFGWSYNTTTNSQFWFVGLSIPVNLPGIPINNVQAKPVN